MLKRCALLRGSSTSNTVRRKWESNLSEFLSERKQSRGEILTSRFSDIYEKRNFTPVAEVFPHSKYESKRWTGNSQMSDAEHAKMAKRKESFTARRKKQAEIINKGVVAKQTQQSSSSDSAEEFQPHVARVAMIGPPNAGKSTLLNTLVTSHVSAESRRPGTTTDWVKGVAHVHDTQIQLLDTPGVYMAERKGTRAFAQQQPLSLAAWDSLFCAHCVLLTLPVGVGFVEPSRKQLLRELYKRCAARQLPIVLALTKVDVLSSEKKQTLYKHLRADIERLRIPFADTFEVSSALYKGVVDLKDALATFGVPGAWEFPRSDVSDLNLADRVSEIVRETFFEVLPHSMPHVTSHKIVGWTNGEDQAGNKLTKIVVEVFMDRPAFVHAFFAHQLEIATKARDRAKVVLGQNVWFHFSTFVSPCGKQRV